jgi:hypothetical protein
MILSMLAAVVPALVLAVVLAVVISVLWWGSSGLMELRPLLPAREDLPMAGCSSLPGSGSGKKDW